MGVQVTFFVEHPLELCRSSHYHAIEAAEAHALSRRPCPNPAASDRTLVGLQANVCTYVYSPRRVLLIRLISYVLTAHLLNRYIECVETLDNALTFCFTDVMMARDFIAKHAPTKIIRNINISLRLKPLFTELYFPGPDGEPQPHIGGLPVTAKNNPWEDLCRRLSALPDLRQLHIRLDSEDLRAWHKRVNEKKFCETLFQARARNYVLDVPNIPDDPSLQGLPGCYLEGDVLEKAPFELVRGSRPNNWQLHLSRVSLLLIDRRPH